MHCQTENGADREDYISWRPIRPDSLGDRRWVQVAYSGVTTSKISLRRQTVADGTSSLGISMRRECWRIGVSPFLQAFAPCVREQFENHSPRWGAAMIHKLSEPPPPRNSNLTHLVCRSVYGQSGFFALWVLRHADGEFPWQPSVIGENLANWSPCRQKLLMNPVDVQV